MGVQGLWALLEPAGKPIPLETLENKQLKCNYSSWLTNSTCYVPHRPTTNKFKVEVRYVSYFFIYNAADFFS